MNETLKPLAISFRAKSRNFSFPVARPAYAQTLRAAENLLAEIVRPSCTLGNTMRHAAWYQ